MYKTRSFSANRRVSLPRNKIWILPIHATEVFLIFLAITLLFYLPILNNPQSILQRGNDLQEYYWPVYYFARQEILVNHTFPLWNNLFFSGSPLLTDPQGPLFYIPNIIFLLIPIDSAFIASFILHSLFAGLGVYIASRQGFGLSRSASIITGLLYILFPRTVGFLEAGHFGPFALFSWLPFLVLASIRLIKTPNLNWSILFAVSLAGLFYTFPTMFLIAAILAFILLLATGSYLLAKNRTYQTLLFLAASILLTFGLTAVTLLPQMEWLPHTTRFLLLNNPDVYPKWNSKIEFARALYPQILGGEPFIHSLDNEKWIAIGFFISLLAIVGFLQLKKRVKLLISITILGIVLIALNNASPVYRLLLSTEWYVLGRVSTRIWFVFTLIIVFLAGFGFEKIFQKGLQKLALIIAFLAIGELLLLAWVRTQMPIPTPKEYASPFVYEFLKKDPGQFRVFCVNRCLSQKDVAKYNIETIEGYGTIYQKNYYDQFIQLSQVFMDKYSSVLPPFEIYNFTKIQPYSPELAEYNVKYVISPHVLTDKNFIMQQKIGNYFIYVNPIVKGRAYYSDGTEAPLVNRSANYIKIDTTSLKTNELIVAEVYNPGWHAILNGQKEVQITETKNKLRRINIENDTVSVELYYYPKGFVIGKLITLVTTFIICAYFLYLLMKKNPQRTRK